MRRMLVALAIALLFPLEGQADQNENKDEDDYVKEWCPANGGTLSGLSPTRLKWIALLTHTSLSLSAPANGVMSSKALDKSYTMPNR